MMARRRRAVSRPVRFSLLAFLVSVRSSWSLACLLQGFARKCVRARLGGRGCILHGVTRHVLLLHCALSSGSLRELEKTTAR